MNIRHSVSCQNVLFSYHGFDSSEVLFLSPFRMLTDSVERECRKQETFSSMKYLCNRAFWIVLCLKD